MDQKSNYFQDFTDIYEKFFQDDENIQAKIKPILNQIYDNRVLVKELHSQYGILFSEITNSYRSRLEELKDHCDKLISDLHTNRKLIEDSYNKVLEDQIQELTLTSLYPN